MRLFRACLVLAIVVIAVVSWQQLYLRVMCPEIVELPAAQLEHNENWTSTDPVWVHLVGATTPIHPAIVTSSRGQQRAALLPLASLHDPKKILAVVSFESTSSALAHYAPGKTLSISGIGRVPSEESEVTLLNYGVRNGLSVSPVWRMVTPNEEPYTLSQVATLSLLSTLLLVLFFLSIRYQRTLLSTLDRASEPVKEKLELIREKVAMLVARRESQDLPDEPLPAATRIRVRSMMDDIWDETVGRSRA